MNPANGTYEFPGQGHVNHGALDYKVGTGTQICDCYFFQGTNAALMKKLQFVAQGGPTWGKVPSFKWSEFDFVRLILINYLSFYFQKDKVKHVGHPDEWKFNKLVHKWETEI